MSPSVNPPRQKLLRCGLILLAAGYTSLCAAVPIQAAPDASTLQKHRSSIEALPEAERKELQRKYEAYQRLPAAEQTRLRELHEQLVADSKRGGKLTQSLQSYAAWLKTLDNADRIKIRQATSPQQKRAEVQRVLQAENRRRSEEARRLLGPSNRFGGPPVVLAPDVLDAVMQLFEDDLRTQGILTPAWTERLQTSAQHGTLRYFSLFAALAEYRSAQPDPGREYQPAPETIEKIKERIQPPPDMLRGLEEANQRAGQQPQRTLLNMLLMVTVHSVNTQIRTSLQIQQPAELAPAIFQTMPPEDQQHLLESSPREQTDEFAMGAWFVLLQAVLDPRDVQRWQEGWRRNGYRSSGGPFGGGPPGGFGDRERRGGGPGQDRKNDPRDRRPLGPNGERPPGRGPGGPPPDGMPPNGPPPFRDRPPFGGPPPE